jgi:uncharacterized protein YjbJ (UPF0337 family)
MDMETVTWSCVRGDWGQYKGQIKQRWAKLTDDDLAYINGDLDLLLNRLQLRYGMPREHLEAQLEEFGGPDYGSPDEGWMARTKRKLGAVPAKAKEYFEKHNVREMIGEVEVRIRNHPIPCALAGMGVGFLLGMLLSGRRKVHVT